MTTPLQVKLIDRSSSGTIAGGGGNNSNSNNNDKWIECICKFIHVLSTIIQFCSPVVIIVASLLYDSMIVTAVAFGLFLLKILVLDLFLFKMGKIQNYLQNKIDMITATIVVLSTVILGIMFSRTNDQFQIVFDIIVYGILTASIVIAWLFENPIGRIFVSDKVEDTVPFTHPVVIHFIQLTSGVMMCTLFLSFMLSIAAKAYYDHGEKETASAFSHFGLSLFDGMVFFIYFYRFYFNTNIEKIAAKYEKGISKQMDNNYHPNNNNNNV